MPCVMTDIFRILSIFNGFVEKYGVSAPIFYMLYIVFLIIIYVFWVIVRLMRSVYKILLMFDRF